MLKRAMNPPPKHSAPTALLSQLFRTVFRGIGQVIFQNNPWSGLLFLLGIGLSSPSAALATFVGALVGTLSAQLLKLPKEQIQNGLHGFNGALVGVAMAVFFPLTPLAWLLLVAGASSSAPLGAALARLLAPLKLAVLTAPFVLLTWMLLLIAPQFVAPLATSEAATLPAIDSASLLVFASGWTRGLGQIFLQDSIGTGVLFALGLALNSRVAALSALCGSALGWLFAWSLGLPLSDLHQGLFGFNAALTAVALYTFLRPTRLLIPYAATGAAISVLATLGLNSLLSQASLPALTAPFVVVTWAFVFLAPKVLRAKEVGAGEAGEAGKFNVIDSI